MSYQLLSAHPRQLTQSFRQRHPQELCRRIRILLGAPGRLRHHPIDESQGRQVLSGHPKRCRGLFGFSFPKLGGIFGGDEDEINEIDTVIRSVSIDRSGKYTLVMDDDAVWVQIDTTKLPRQPKPGQKVHIKTATMGSYFATIEGGRAIRLKRDR